MLSSRLDEVVRQRGAVGTVVFDASGKELCRVGAVESVARAGLFHALFGGPGEVQRLRDSLEGQLLPQIWSQGLTNCFVSRLANGILYGVFSEGPLDSVELYHASQKAARLIEPVLQAATGSQEETSGSAEG
jgi:hypothetical protein